MTPHCICEQHHARPELPISGILAKLLSALNNLAPSKNLPRHFLYTAMAKLLWVLNNLKAPYLSLGLLGAIRGEGLTSFKVVLAGEKRGLLVYAGVFCQRHIHQNTRGLFESPGSNWSTLRR
jgi:hypothetical protein